MDVITPERRLEGVDPAAVVATTLALVIAWTSTEGQWSWITTPVGIMAIAVLLGFYHPPSTTSRRRRAFQRLAYATVLAFAICLTAAPFVQKLVNHFSSVYTLAPFRSPVVTLTDEFSVRQAQANVDWQRDQDNATTATNLLLWGWGALAVFTFMASNVRASRRRPEVRENDSRQSLDIDKPTATEASEVETSALPTPGPEPMPRSLS